MSRQTLRVFGLLSGTSLDGIDVADVELRFQPDGELQQTLLHFETVPWAEPLRANLLEAQPPADPSLQDVAELNVAAGEAFASAALRCAALWKVDVRALDAIGSHGQTLWHAPEIAATVQIGEPAIIAERTGVTCVSDFRAADMAAGGQGAPLVPYVDWHLFRSDRETRCALNIGGIANVTVLPRSGGRDAVRAFDTGPGNMVIDACARAASGGAATYDAGGTLAGRGAVCEQLLTELMDDDYIAKPPPKSTGRERYGDAFARAVAKRAHVLGLGPADLLATVTALTAQSVARQLPSECARLIVSGGGAHNATLMRMLGDAVRSRCGSVAVDSSAAHGVPPDAKEAIAFAVLAGEALRGGANDLPACTGARRAVVLGKISPGDNFGRLMGALFATQRA